MKKLIYFICFSNLFVFILNQNLKIDQNNKSTECNLPNCQKCEQNNNNNKCIECANEYLLNEGKCYNAEAFKSFMDTIKNSASNKEISVIDYVLKDVYREQQKNENKSENVEILKFESLSKDFNSIKDIISNMQRVNERECRMKINEFIVNFEQNMQVLLSLANLFEQKTIFEIEKKRNSILQYINADGVDPSTKLKVVSQNLEDLTEMITSTMESIRKKIKSYQEISEKKIDRAKNSFLIKIKKFLK